MAFGDFEFNPRQTLTPDEIIASFDIWKENKTKVAHLLLIKDCGLNPETEFSFETRGGQKINVVHFRYKGISSTFDITSRGINLRSKESLNDTSSGSVDALEDAIVEEQKQALLEYFSMQRSDRPED